jgi:heat shock protein HslJ
MSAAAVIAAMMNRLAILCLAGLVAGLLAACSAAASGPPLDGRTFLSTRVLQAGVDRPLVPGTQIRLTFAGDGQLSASAGCNIFGGTYRVADGRLLVEGGGMTEMGCDEPRHAQDEWLFALLGAQPRVTLAGNELVLDQGAVQLGLLDREVAEPDLPLVGRLWTVVSVLSGDAVSSIPDGVVASLQFGADGQFQVATGCNQGSGRYTIEGATLRFTDLILTKRACEVTTSQMESAVLAIVGKDAAPATFAIDAATLSLSVGANGLQLNGG